MESQYHEIYKSWEHAPEQFWREAAKEITWDKEPEQIFDAKSIAMMLNNEENVKVPQTSHELRVAIMQARNTKGLTQEKLALLLNIPKNDVNAFEGGKLVPTGAIISKMDKVLGVKLPRPQKKQ